MDTTFKPGFGPVQPKIDTSYQPGIGQPGDKLLMDAHQLAQQAAEDTEHRYLATVEGYVCGETSADEIHHACKAAGKTLQDFEADAELLRERHRLMELVASEPEAQRREAELQQAFAEANQRRQRASVAMLNAQNDYLRAQTAEGDAAERLERFRREELVNIGNARHRLQTDPEMIKFASAAEQCRAAEIKQAEEAFEQARLATEEPGQEMMAARERVERCANRVASLQQPLAVAQQKMDGASATQLATDLEKAKLDLQSAQHEEVDTAARHAVAVKTMEDAQRRVRELKRM